MFICDVNKKLPTQETLILIEIGMSMGLHAKHLTKNSTRQRLTDGALGEGPGERRGAGRDAGQRPAHQLLHGRRGQVAPGAEGEAHSHSQGICKLKA